MNGRDPHRALKNEIISKEQSQNASFVIVKLQWGKDDIAFSLHIQPRSWSTAGIQITDFLSHLGFQRNQCSFADGRECYWRWVDEGFDLKNFMSSFGSSFEKLLQAQKDLEKCGFFFDQPEGWGYYYGRHSSGRSYRSDIEMDGDGHTAAESKVMKNSEDDNFRFIFTWIENDENDKGWVIHYLPKHPPLSSEIQSVFKFLGIKDFSQCPHFDFEPCNWKSIKFISRGDDFFDGNANTAHGWFDAHASNFSPGIQKLLSANADVEKAGFSFLPFSAPQKRLEEDIEKRTIRPKSSTSKSDLSYFDVAISFAGTDRQYAEKLATLLKDSGFSVFYDEFYPEYLWGKNLVDTFDEIFRKRARYCVMFISKEYNDRVWTNHERQSAQARALKEKGKEYILPIKIDETELAGMPPTIGYVSLAKGIEKIAEMLIKKLKGEK